MAVNDAWDLVEDLDNPGGSEDESYDFIEELIDTDPIELGRRYRRILMAVRNERGAQAEVLWQGRPEWNMGLGYLIRLQGLRVPRHVTVVATPEP